MKYKGYDLDEFVFYIRNFGVTTSGVIDYPKFAQSVTYFGNKGFPEFGAIMRMAFDQDGVEGWSYKAIKVENSKIVVSKDLESISTELNGLNEFSKISESLIGVTIAIPLIGAFLASLPVLQNVIGIFTSEARTKSFNMQKDVDNYSNSLNSHQFPEGSMGRHIRDLSYTSTYRLAKLRPACIAPTDNCNVDHLRYYLRGEFTLNGCKTFIELVEKYFNEPSFKDFIDDWELIKAKIKAVIPAGSELTEKGNIQPQKAGCLPVILVLLAALSALGTIFIF